MGDNYERVRSVGGGVWMRPLFAGQETHKVVPIDTIVIDRKLLADAVENINRGAADLVTLADYYARLDADSGEPR